MSQPTTRARRTGRTLPRAELQTLPAEKNLILEAKEVEDRLEDELYELVSSFTRAEAVRENLVDFANVIYKYKQEPNESSEEELIKEVNMQFDFQNDEQRQQYIQKSFEYVQSSHNFSEAFFKVVVQDRGFPRRACHSLYKVGTPINKPFRAANYFKDWDIKPKRVYQDKAASWNDRYVPDVPDNQLTIIRTGGYPKPLQCQLPFRGSCTVGEVVEQAALCWKEVVIDVPKGCLLHIGNRVLDHRMTLDDYNITSGTVLKFTPGYPMNLDSSSEEGAEE